MKTLVLSLALLTGCSSFRGANYGILHSVRFGGLIFNSCEITLKSLTTPTEERRFSAKSEKLCVVLSEKVGTSVLIYWTTSRFNPTMESTREVEQVFVPQN